SRSRAKMAPPAGFEPATTRLEGECSIQLSYGVIASISLRQPRYNRSVANAVVAEIVRIALRLLGAVLRPDHRVVETIFGRKGDRLLHRLEMYLHLVQSVFGADPSHQRLGLTASSRFIGEYPFSGPPSGLHCRFCRLEDSRPRHRRASRSVQPFPEGRPPKWSGREDLNLRHPAPKA